MSDPSASPSSPELRLRDLTEHCLRILDDLVRAREQARDRDELQARVIRLEEMLADARSRVRAAGSVVLGSGGRTEAEWELVVWGADRADDKRCRELIAAAGQRPVTLLVRQARPQGKGQLPEDANLCIIETGEVGPAESWNLAMTCSEADVVVCLWAGATAKAEALEALAGAAAPGTAVVAPAVRTGRLRTIGQEEQGPMLFEPRKTARSDGEMVALACAQPEAFALRREAFHQLGPFDQDLHTSVALEEWCRRAQTAQFRLLGMARIEVAARRGYAAQEREQGATGRARDRLLALARHQPDDFAAVAVAGDLLWTSSAEELAELLRAASARLSADVGPRAATELLLRQVQQFAARSVPEDSVREHLADMERVLQGSLEIGEGHYSEQLRAVVDGVRASVGQNHRALREVLERLEQEVAAERRGKEELTQQLEGSERTIEELRQDLARHRHAERENKDQLLAKSGTIDALKDELAGRDRAVHSLQEHRIGLEAELKALGATCDDLRRRVDGAAEAIALARSLELRLADTTQQLEACEDHLHRAEEETARSKADLRRAHDDHDQIAVQLRRVEIVLREREEWIAVLLREARRFRVLPRRLQDHERDFLQRRGGPGGP